MTAHRKIIPYNPKLKEIARNLRNNSTLAEILLWKRLKGKQMLGYDFHRQKPILKYIVDFFCNEIMLAIEVDGSTHDESKYNQDIIRQKEIERLGITFLRFNDKDVIKDMENVMNVIENWVKSKTHEKHTPSPSQEGK